MIKKTLLVLIISVISNFSFADVSTMNDLNGLEQMDIAREIIFAIGDFDDPELLDFVDIHMRTAFAGGFYDDLVATTELDCSLLGDGSYNCSLAFLDRTASYDAEIYNAVVVTAEVVEFENGGFRAFILDAQNQ